MQDGSDDVTALTALVTAVGPNIFNVADHRGRSIADVTAQHFSLAKLDGLAEFLDGRYGVRGLHTLFLACLLTGLDPRHSFGMREGLDSLRARACDPRSITGTHYLGREWPNTSARVLGEEEP